MDILTALSDTPDAPLRFTPGDRLTAEVFRTAFVISTQTRNKKNNNDPYWSAILDTPAGQLPVVCWDIPGADSPMSPMPGQFIRANSFTDDREKYRSVTLKGIRILTTTLDDLPKDLAEELCPNTGLTAIEGSRIWNDLTKASRWGEDVFDKAIRAWSLNVIDAEVGIDRFKNLPAATGKHHNYRHGLIQHTLEVMNTAHAMADASARSHLIDRRVLSSAVLLHDLGKARGYEFKADGSIGFLPWERAVGHIATGVGFIMKHEDDAPFDSSHSPVKARFISSVIHAIGAHHGRTEWDSLWEPHSMEAFILHCADMESAQSAMLAAELAKGIPHGSEDQNALVLGDQGKKGVWYTLSDQAASHAPSPSAALDKWNRIHALIGDR